MALVGGALEPGLGRAQVDGDAAPEAIGLAEVEGGVGIAFLGERAPDGDGAVIIALLPRLDAGLDGLRLGERWRGDRSDDSKADDAG